MMSAPQSVPDRQDLELSQGPLVVGVDVGTTAVKAVLVGADGRVVARHRELSRLSVGPGGRFEHDAAATWWEAPRAALKSLLAGTPPASVKAVAVSAMMPSVGAVDATGVPKGPGLLYGDARGSGGRPGVGLAVGPGGDDPMSSDEMGRLAAWAAANEPGAFGYWPAQAVANAALGGQGTVDFASAMASGPLFNGSNWDEEACAAAGLTTAQLPEVAMFGEVTGSLRADAGPEGVALAAGSVDGLCEQLVAGAVEDGDVLVALGSTLVVWLCVPGWPECPAGLWRVPHLAAGKAMVGGASNAGGMWADWVDRALRPGAPSEAEPHDVPLWWPWARGERVPYHDSRLRARLDGADLAHGPAALRRAAYEATGFVVRDILRRAAATGTAPRRFVVSGGGSANRDWVQALADVLATPVRPLEVPESAALGAAFLARLAVGLESTLDDGRRWGHLGAAVEPDEAWAVAAAGRYERWAAQVPGPG